MRERGFGRLTAHWQVLAGAGLTHISIRPIA